MTRLSFLVLAAAASCYHGGVKDVSSPGGVVELTNGTGEPLEVFANGQRVAMVKPSESVMLDRLPLGDCRIEAIGRLTGFTIRAEMTLAGDTPVKWRFAQSQAHSERLQALPAGIIRAVNKATEPVRVFIDGMAREMIWSGGEAEYAGIRLGLHRLRAEGVKTGFSVDHEVIISPDVKPVFVVSPPLGALSVRNRSGQASLVTVKGVSSRVLDPGDSITVDKLSPGSYAVTAGDRLGRPMWAGTVEVRRGEVASAEIPPGAGVLAVVSDLDVPVTIVADGIRLGDCAAHGAAEFKGLPVGQAKVQAYGLDGDVRARGRISIPASGQAVWMVKPGHAREALADEGSLLVVNRSAETIRLRIDNWDRGEVRPGGRRLFAAMVAGRHGVAAVGARTGEVHRAEVNVGPGAQVTWESGAPLATLALTNARREEVRVLLDEVDLGLIAPAGQTVFKVAAGVHRMETRGVTTLDTTIQDLDLPAATATSRTLGPVRASVVVTNRHGEPLSVSLGDRELGVVLPGDRVTLNDCEPGTRKLTARSLRGPLSWSVTVTLGSGDQYDWELKQ